MTQNVLATIDPEQTDGFELAAWLEQFKVNEQTAHKGIARPSYAQAGLVWLKDVSGTVQELYLDDGAAGILIGTMNPTADTWRSSDTVIGKHLIPVGAGGMVPLLGVNGPQFGTLQVGATNLPTFRTLDFDTAGQEYACFSIPMPKSWNRSTLTFIPIWTAGSGSGGVVWALQAAAVSDAETLDAAYGAAQVVIDTFLGANILHRGPESAAITVAGAPAIGDTVDFRIFRNVGHASDTLAVDARLIGLEIYATTAAGNDA